MTSSADIAAELELAKRTIDRAYARALGKLRPLFAQATEAELAILLLALLAHLRGDDFFSTVDLGFEQEPCPIFAKRPQHREHAERAAAAQSPGKRTGERRARIPSRWRNDDDER